MMENKHPLIYPTPTAEQLDGSDKTHTIEDIKKHFPLVYDGLVKGAEKNWEYIKDDEDASRGAKSPQEFIDNDLSGYHLAPVVGDGDDESLVACFLDEDYVEVMPGHMILYLENNGFTNVTLVVIGDLDEGLMMVG